MANILVQIELSNQKPTQACLSLINEGRTIAGRLGATLYAMLPCARPPTYGDDDIIAVLSHHGVDKVILLTHPDLGGELTQEQKDIAIRLACSRFPPRLVLLQGSEENMVLAAALAFHLEGQYTCMDSLGFTPEERTPFFDELKSGEPGDDLPEGMRILVECEGPLVLTLAPEDPPIHMGDEEAEVVVLHPRMPGEEKEEQSGDIPCREAPTLDMEEGAQFGREETTADPEPEAEMDLNPDDPTP